MHCALQQLSQKTHIKRTELVQKVAYRRPRWESNPDLKIRSLLFCPLNYEGTAAIIADF